MALVTLTVQNVVQDTAGSTSIRPLSSTQPEPLQPKVVILSMLVVAVDAIVMWYAYSDWIRPSVIHIQAGYVPFAGIIVVTAGLERLLYPLNRLLDLKDRSAVRAAQSKSAVQRAAADPTWSSSAMQPLLDQAAADQAAADGSKNGRAIISGLSRAPAEWLSQAVSGFSFSNRWRAGTSMLSLILSSPGSR